MCLARLDEPSPASWPDFLPLASRPGRFTSEAGVADALQAVTLLQKLSSQQRVVREAS